MILDNLKRMAIFAAVVDAGSFSGAARRLGLAKSAVSKHVSMLEKNLGVPLLHRSTRQLNLTDIGESYYQSCRRMMEAVDEAQQATDGLQGEPRGVLRVTSPVSVGERVLAPLIRSFMDAYPEVQIELLLEDSFTDMVKEGIDVGVRVGWLPDSGLRARKLGDVPRMICASPDYLARHGTPSTPEELAEHDWVIFTLLPSPQHLTLNRNKETRTVALRGKARTNNSSAARALMLEGVGIGVLSDFLVAEDIWAGRLVLLLPEYRVPDAGIYAVYQPHKTPQPKIRHFIDHLATNL